MKTKKNTNPADKIICYCSGTTQCKIKTLFEQGLDLGDISRRTGAGSGCGGCALNIAQFLNELAAHR